MNIHQNASLTPRGRAILVSRLDRGEHPVDVAAAMGVGIRTVYKWRHRYRTEGVAGFLFQQVHVDAEACWRSSRNRPASGAPGPSAPMSG